MTTTSHITVILNPAAGRGKARKVRDRLLTALASSGLDHSFVETTGRGTGTALAKDAAERSSIVVAVGGDGTVNEVASGLVNTPAALAVLSVGSGNDFARTVGAPTEPEVLIERLRAPRIAHYDAGTVKMVHTHGLIDTRYFFNSAGIGFDASVARNVTSIRFLRGIPLYLLALLRTMIGYKPHYLKLRIEGHHRQNFYFLVCIGIGKWEGGGFMLTPDAKPDDGMFQVCGVTGRSISRILPILPSVMTGTHIGKEHIETFDTNSMTIITTGGFPIHGDGEIFGWSVMRADVNIHPGALKVVVPHTA